MFILCRRVHGIFFSTSRLSSQSPLLSARTWVSAPVKPPLIKLQEPAYSHIAEVPDEYKLRNMVENFKLRCAHAAFREKLNSYKDMVRRLTIAKKFSWIEEILEDQKKYMPHAVNEYFVRGIIALYGNAGMFDHARKLFEEMPQLGYNPPSVKSFTCLLDACVRSGHLDKLEEIFREIPGKLPIVPDLISYTVLMKGYLEMGSVDSMLSTMREMKQKGIKPDTFIYALLLDGLYKNGRAAESEDVWDLMESKGIAPCIRCYNTKLRFLTSEKRMKEALNLFTELESKGVKPDQLTFCVLFEGLRVAKNLEGAKRLYQKLSSKSIRANHSICEILIPFATEMGDLESAVNQCYVAMNAGTFLDQATLQAVLDGLVRECKVEKARKLLNSFQEFSGIYTCKLKGC